MTLRTRRTLVVGLLLTAGSAAAVFLWGLRRWSELSPSEEKSSGPPAAAEAPPHPDDLPAAPQVTSNDAVTPEEDTDPEEGFVCPETCPVGWSCAAGACVRAACGSAPPRTGCLLHAADGGSEAGECCEGHCRTAADFEKDALACGGCGQHCPEESGCLAGRCAAPDGGELAEVTCRDGEQETMRVDLGSSTAESTRSVFCQRVTCAGARDGTACDEGVCCGERCLIDTDHDPRHCGGCDIICHGGDVCVDGACIPHARCGAQNDPSVPCALPDGEDGLCCDDRCIDPSRDDAHCGRCSTQCHAGRFCAEGECRVANCSGRTVDDRCTVPDSAGTVGACCRGACVDPDSAFDADPANCGSCGVACVPDATCARGRCRDADAGTPFDCLTDGCPTGTFCASHACFPARCQGDIDGLRCQRDAGEGVCCRASCVDVLVDRSNCGTCGIACAPSLSCQDGRCETPEDAPAR